MKIAICISGHLRSCHLYIQNFKEKILDVLEENNIDYDIYLLTYSNIVSTPKYAKEKNLPINKDITEETNNSLEVILENIKIKKYLIKKQTDETIDRFQDYDYMCIKKKNNIVKVNDEFFVKEEMRHRGICQIKHRNECFDLIENLEDYKYILWRRPDIFYFDKLDVNLIKNYKITFPNNHRFGGTQVHFTTVIGVTKVMKRVMKLYDIIKKNNYEIIDMFNNFYKTRNFFPNLLPIFFMYNIKNYNIYFNSFRDTISRVVDGKIIYEDRDDWNILPNHNITPEFDLSLCKSNITFS